MYITITLNKVRADWCARERSEILMSCSSYKDDVMCQLSAHRQHFRFDVGVVMAGTDDTQEAVELVVVLQVVDGQPQSLHHHQSVTSHFRRIDPEFLLAIFQHHAREQLSHLVLA